MSGNPKGTPVVSLGGTFPVPDRSTVSLTTGLRLTRVSYCNDSLLVTVWVGTDSLLFSILFKFFYKIVTVNGLGSLPISFKKVKTDRYFTSRVDRIVKRWLDVRKIGTIDLRVTQVLTSYLVLIPTHNLLSTHPTNPISLLL